MRIIIAMLLLSATSATSATYADNVTIEGLLNHNRHLLYLTSIGKSLKESEKLQVQELYTKSTSLYLKARTAHKTGASTQAKSLSHKSIRVFYVADRVLYMSNKNRNLRDIDEEDYVW